MSKQPTKRPLTSTNYLLKLYSLAMLIHITFESFIHNLNKSYSRLPCKIKVIIILFSENLIFKFILLLYIHASSPFSLLYTENEADDSQRNR